jgi:phospholipid/cholesterol/gamma-HCH transport system substrate-binding protein
MSSPSTPATAVRVGIFFVLGMGILLGLSLFVSQTELGRKTYTLIAHFREGQGLEVGSDVTIRGVPVGKVTRIELDPAGPEGRRVRLLLSIDRRYQLPRDSVATVRFQSLLGQNFIYVRDGDAAERLRPGESIITEEGADLQKVVAQIAGLGESAKALFEEFRVKGNNVLDQISLLLDENRENIRQTTQAFANAAPKVETLVTNVNDLIEGVREGRGSLGKMVTDDEAYNNITQLAADLKDISAKIKQGEGSLGKLVNDEALHNTLQSSFQRLEEAAVELRDILGDNREDVRTFVEQLAAVGPKLRQTLDNAREISEKINQGQGTLGKLVNDPSLYNDVKRAVNQIGETFEGGEEQGVIRSFFGVLFGALL